MLVKQDGQTIHREAHYIGRWPALSNNVCEHAGAIASLRWCLKNNVTQATIYGDADMIIKQLNGKWRAREGEYIPYFKEGRALRLQLPDVQLVWIPREMNDEADALSRISVGRLPLIVTFELDPTVDTSAVVITPLKESQQRRREERKKKHQRRHVTDEMMDLFMMKTAD